MNKVVELASNKPHSTSRRHALRKLSPVLIVKARDETATQVTRVGLTFVGTTAFCLLSLFTPDSALLGGTERISVPLAGPVSFFGFVLLGPAVLIALRVYLQIYVEHGDRLDRLARAVSIGRAPTLVALDNSLIRLLSGVVFYALLPVAMLLFAWKAAVFPAWGLGLFSAAAAVIVSHILLPFGKLSWPSKGVVAACSAIIAGAVLHDFGPPRRPFNLFRANLSGHWLSNEDLRKANLYQANLSGAVAYEANLSGAMLTLANLSGANLNWANLSGAILGGANLSGAKLHRANLSGNAILAGANLSGANLFYANLSGAMLTEANLRDADLVGANLSGADFAGANLSGAKLDRANLSGADLRYGNVDQWQLNETCGDANTKLLKDLTIKPCQ